MLFDEIGNIGCYLDPIRVSHGVAENHIRSRESRKVPATEGQDSFRAADLLKLLKLIGRQDITRLNFKFGVRVPKPKWTCV